MEEEDEGGVGLVEWGLELDERRLRGFLDVVRDGVSYMVMIMIMITVMICEEAINKYTVTQN